MTGFDMVHVEHIEPSNLSYPSGNETYQILGDGDYDTRHMPYIGHIKQLPLWEVVIKSVVYSLCILVSLMGNAAVIIVVWRNKRMWTTTNFYIVNLAVSDLMISASCQWVHLTDDLTEGWMLGAFFCKFNSFVQVLSLVSSILTLTLIACDRFFGIVFAMKAHLSGRRARTALIVVWILSLTISSPLLFFRKQEVRNWANHTEIWCDDAWPAVSWKDPSTNFTFMYHPSKTIYYTFTTVVLFFLPVGVMTFTYSVVIIKLWSKRQPGERIDSSTQMQNKRKKQVVVMLVVIVWVFVLCWLPLQVAILYSEFRHDAIQQLPAWYTHFQFSATFIAYANSGINPIIYTAFNARFRTGFRDTFRVQLGKGPYRAVTVKLTTLDRSSNGPHNTVVANSHVTGGKTLSVRL